MVYVTGVAGISDAPSVFGDLEVGGGTLRVSVSVAVLLAGVGSVTPVGAVIVAVLAEIAGGGRPNVGDQGVRGGGTDGQVDGVGDVSGSADRVQVAPVEATQLQPALVNPAGRWCR